LRTPARRFRKLRNGAKDNLNLDFFKVVIGKVDDLVKSFLADVRLGLTKSLVLPLDRRTPHRPLP
jgi:hypothetical protein